MSCQIKTIQLFIDGVATTLFFTETATYDDVFEWVQKQVMFDETNMFNLNEQHSCSLSVGIDESMTINGDEDRVLITIEEIKPIK